MRKGEEKLEVWGTLLGTSRSRTWGGGYASQKTHSQGKPRLSKPCRGKKEAMSPVVKHDRRNHLGMSIKAECGKGRGRSEGSEITIKWRGQQKE